MKMEMDGKHEAIYTILRQFAEAHTYLPGGGVCFDDYKSTEEIDLILNRIDMIQMASEITDEVWAATHPDDPKNLERALVASISQSVPLIVVTFLGRHLRGIQYALKKSAEADLVCAIIQCERFLEESIGDEELHGRIIKYSDRMERSLSRLHRKRKKKKKKTEEDESK